MRGIYVRCGILSGTLLDLLCAENMGAIVRSPPDADRVPGVFWSKNHFTLDICSTLHSTATVNNTEVAV